MSHHGLAPKERHLPPVKCHSIARGPITASTTRRARAASSRVLPPPGKQPAQWRLRVGHARAGCAFEVIARTSHHGLAPKERGLPSVQGPSMSRRTIAASAPRRARARQARMFCDLPRDSQRSGGRSRATRTPAARWRVQLARRTTVLHRRREASRRCSALPWRVGRANQRSTLARAASSRVSPPPERQPAQWRLRACHAKPAARWRSQLARRTTVLHRRREAFRRCSACSCAHGPIDNQRGTAHARGKLACFATSRETASAVAPVRLPRECRLRVGGHSSHVAPRLCIKERGLSPVQCHFYGAWAQYAERGTLRARQARVCRHLPRDSQRSGARSCATRRPGVCWRSQLARRTTVLH